MRPTPVHLVSTPTGVDRDGFVCSRLFVTGTLHSPSEQCLGTPDAVGPKRDPKVLRVTGTNRGWSA